MRRQHQILHYWVPLTIGWLLGCGRMETAPPPTSDPAIAEPLLATRGTAPAVVALTDEALSMISIPGPLPAPIPLGVSPRSPSAAETQVAGLHALAEDIRADGARLAVVRVESLSEESGEMRLSVTFLAGDASLASTHQYRAPLDADCRGGLAYRPGSLAFLVVSDASALAAAADGRPPLLGRSVSGTVGELTVAHQEGGELVVEFPWGGVALQTIESEIGGPR